MSAAPPLRFLALVVGGWACIRLAVLAPGWWPEAIEAARPQRPDTPYEAARPPAPAIKGATAPATVRPLRPVAALPREPAAKSPQRTFLWVRPIVVAAEAPPTLARTPPLNAPPPVAALQPGRTGAPRWSGSAWLLRREGREPALAPGGTLGGSQVGIRLLYRLNRDPRRPLSLSGRLYWPLGNRSGGEAAAGLDWRPDPRVPINLLVERRQRLGREGRSAFAVTLYGGGAAPLPGGLRLAGYGQAGAVGMRSRDLFVDGSARVTAQLGRVELGAGAWGAAQPGGERLDIGPHLSIRLPIEGANLRLSADWRFRIAGDAAPGSGPAITLASDF